MFLISRDTNLLSQNGELHSAVCGSDSGVESRFQRSAGALVCRPRAMPEADMKRAFGAIHCCSGGVPAAGEQPSTMGTSSLHRLSTIEAGD